jgi:hypothetical protein
LVSPFIGILLSFLQGYANWDRLESIAAYSFKKLADRVYSVYLTHDKGVGPAYAVMTDVLPAEVKLAGGPTVTELDPSASPLVAYFDSHVGPNGAVGWRGALSPGAAIRVDFPVRVMYCPNDVQVIRNKAVVSQLGATSVLSAVVETVLKCEPLPKPDIELRKYVVTDLGEEATTKSRTRFTSATRCKAA